MDWHRDEREKKMKTQINLNRAAFLLLTSIILRVSVFVAQAQNTPKFKVGDRVECDYIGTHEYWNKGTVVAFPENDSFNGYRPDSGYYYRVKFDGQDSATYCKAVDVRPLVATKSATEQNADANQTGVDEKPEVSTDNPNNDNQNQQIENGEYKVGDRVEIRIGGDWYPATVTRGLQDNGYRVVEDRFV